MLHLHTTWSDTLIRLVVLANRLEREGQYSVAKLPRASADAMVRQAAYAIDLPPDRHVLAQETEDAAGALTAIGLGDGLATALGRGAAGLREGRFTMIDETPDASIC